MKIVRSGLLSLLMGVFLFHPSVAEAFNFCALFFGVKVKKEAPLKRPSSRTRRNFRPGAEFLEERKNPVGLGYGIGETVGQFMDVLVQAQNELKQSAVTETTDIGPLRNLNGQISVIQTQIQNLQAQLGAAQVNLATYQVNAQGDLSDVSDQQYWYRTTTHPYVVQIGKDNATLGTLQREIAGEQRILGRSHLTKAERNAALNALAKYKARVSLVAANITNQQNAMAQATAGSAVDQLNSDDAKVAFYTQQILTTDEEISALNSQVAPLLAQAAPIQNAYGNAEALTVEDDAAIPYLVNALTSSQLANTTALKAFTQSFSTQFVALADSNPAGVSYLAQSIWAGLVQRGMMYPTVTLTSVSVNQGPYQSTVFDAMASEAGAKATIKASFIPTFFTAPPAPCYPIYLNPVISISSFTGTPWIIGGVVIDPQLLNGG